MQLAQLYPLYLELLGIVLHIIDLEPSTQTAGMDRRTVIVDIAYQWGLGVYNVCTDFQRCYAVLLLVTTS